MNLRLNRFGVLALAMAHWVLMHWVAAPTVVAADPLVGNSDWSDLRNQAVTARPVLLRPSGGSAQLELTCFSVTLPRTRFVIASAAGATEREAPQVTLYRGGIAGEPGSHAFIAVTANGKLSGRIHSDIDGDFDLAASPGQNAPTVSWPADAALDMPDLPVVCGVHDVPTIRFAGGGDPPEGLGPANRGPRVAEVAIDADQAFVNLFESTDAAAEYIMVLIGAVSDIYIRDVNVKLVLTFVRLWPDGGEPFSAASISGFRDYWLNNEDPSPYNLVHLLSGRRDTSYGGIAYVGGTCSGQATYAISAYIIGEHQVPIEWANQYNWDITVVAHEIGHNFGTYHTHDGYQPPIDNCGNGVSTRGTIMSYCHTHPGGLANIDLHLHRLVEQVIRDDVAEGACMWFDCNANGVDDAGDLAGGTSLDANGDGVPDECQDCDADGLLDSAEILTGAADVDGNGIPDDCQTDCNGNNIPDTDETLDELAPDTDGNNVPDECDPDCDGNGVPDFDTFVANLTLDLDRNRILDACQDCDDNGVTDWLDLKRQWNVYLGRNGAVREYHRRSGVPIQEFTASPTLDAMDVTFGADRQLYATDSSGNRVIRVDVDSGSVTVFVPAGSSGLQQPTGLVFGPDGLLYVTTRFTASVLRYDGLSGAPVDTFVSSGAGGLTEPFGLTFGPGGDLFVTSADDRVLRFSGADGAFVATFVSAAAGGLTDPRGLAFKPDGNLLVTSRDTNQVLEFDGATGAFVRVFAGLSGPPWGIRIGPEGNAYVVRTSPTPAAVAEYDSVTGHIRRSLVRSDSSFTSPRSFAFRPASPTDCNQNHALDVCDISAGASLDCNANLRPDECDAITPGDFDATGQVALSDLAALVVGLAGPAAPPSAPPQCAAAYLTAFDFDADTDIDLRDFAVFQIAYTGP